MISYEEARDIIRQNTEPGWNIGTYCLDDRMIVETDDVYFFTIGAREFIVEGDLSYAITGTAPVVSKADGRVEDRPPWMEATDPSVRRRPNPNPHFVP